MMSGDRMVPRRSESCLWVEDARKRGHPDPESVRCTPEGAITCRPCMERFDAEGHPDPWEETERVAS